MVASCISYIAVSLEKGSVWFATTQMQESLFLIGECSIELNIYEQMQQVER